MALRRRVLGAAAASATAAAALHFDEDFRRRATIAALGATSRAFFHGLNQVHVHNAHRFHEALSRRASAVALPPTEVCQMPIIAGCLTLQARQRGTAHR